MKLPAHTYVDYEWECKVLPNALHDQLKKLLPQLKLFNSVTSIAMTLKEGDLVENVPLDIREDELEVRMSHEDQILQDIDDMACPQVLESEVAVQSRIFSSTYRAWIKSRPCVEHKIPFASTGKQDHENGVREFFQDLKLCNSLRGCTGVGEFIGVVLDDTRTHLRSYLCESPLIGSVATYLAVVNSRSERIPWPIRELWGRQIIEAVLDIHSKGLIVGAFTLDSVGIRANGTAVLYDLKTSERHLRDRYGEMPPELRNASRGDGKLLPKIMNFRTDTFQLGLVLWLLAEHIAIGGSRFCTRNVCATFPRHSCVADHTNPVELPACGPDIPAYYNDIIQHSRSADPRARPSARQLAATLQNSEQPFDQHSSSLNKLLDNYIECTDGFSIFCDECNMMTTDAYYYCALCAGGEFALCQACFDQGFRCLSQDHRMEKRVTKPDGIVTVVDC